MGRKSLTKEGQVRIVLNPKYRSKAEAVLEATGIDNLSQLFTLLLVHYGDRLVAALKSQQSEE